MVGAYLVAVVLIWRPRIAAESPRPPAQPAVGHVAQRPEHDPRPPANNPAPAPLRPVPDNNPAPVPARPAPDDRPAVADNADATGCPVTTEMRREHRNPIGVEELVRRYLVRNSQPYETHSFEIFGPDMCSKEELEWVRPFEKYMMPAERMAYRLPAMYDVPTELLIGGKLTDAVWVRVVVSTTIGPPVSETPRTSKSAMLCLLVGQQVLDRKSYSPEGLPPDWIERRKKEALDNLRKAHPAIPDADP